MSYPTFVVANAILHRAHERGVSINHLKLQKLVFFTHAWLLALHGVPAVNERPEAWEYGPVFDGLFHRFKDRGGEAIREFIVFADATINAFRAPMPSHEDKTFWRVLDQVMGRYARFDDNQLSTLAHESGGPWEQARRAKQAFIPDESIREHFRRKLQ